MRRENFVWPMQPGGGLFLICIGCGLIYGAFLQGAALAQGLEAGFCAGALGIVAAIKLARGHFGRPTSRHRLALFAAIALELSIFFALIRTGFFAGNQTAVTWMVILSIVALHFLVMRWSHGPLMQWLAVASLCWIGAAYVLDVSLWALMAVDGSLKVAFGAAMAAPLIPIIRAGDAAEVAAK